MSRPLISAGAAVTTFVAAAVVTGVLAVVLGVGGEPDLADGPATPPTDLDDPTVPVTASPGGQLPGATAPAPSPSVPGSPAGSPSPTGGTTSTSTPTGIDVQVLVGTDDGAQVSSVLDVLNALGYVLVDQEPSTQMYEETTIFFTPGAEDAADMLQAADARFTVILPAIEGLDTDIPLHIVVGTDWAS